MLRVSNPAAVITSRTSDWRQVELESAGGAGDGLRGYAKAVERGDLGARNGRAAGVENGSMKIRCRRDPAEREKEKRR